MKTKILLVPVLVLLFSAYSFAANTSQNTNSTSVTYNITGFPRDWQNMGPGNKTLTVEEKLSILESRVKPIIDAFGLNFDSSKIEECAHRDVIKDPVAYWNCKNSVQVKMNLALPETDIERLNYSIVRQGVELNDRTATVRQGDMVRIKPIIPTIRDHGNDWVVQGGEVDSPPIQFIESTLKMQKIYEALLKKYDALYPCSPDTLKTIDECRYAKPFKAEKEAFNGNVKEYTGPLGYPAYVIPLGKNKKAGMQVFCHYDVRGEMHYAEPNHPVTSFGNPGPAPESCRSNKYGGFDCPVKKSNGSVTIKDDASLDCIVFVDKVITGNEAVKADWTTSFSLRNRLAVHTKEFQILPAGKEAPVAEFNCKFTEKNGPIFLECDASKSYDPDGDIKAYLWDTKANRKTLEWRKVNSGNPIEKNYSYDKPTYKRRLFITKKQPVPMELKVTDNDGISSSITKIIDPNASTAIHLTADYDKKTQMALLSLTCPSDEKAMLDITNKITGRSVLEKQPIPCNKTTPVGPIVVTGAYEASVSLAGKTSSAIFTVPSPTAQ